MFKEATKIGLFFRSKKGILSIQDVWQLSDSDLQTLFTQVSARVSQEPSLFGNGNVDKTDKLRFDIIKAVAEDRIAERAADKAEKEKLAQRDIILNAIARKQEEQYNDLDIAELTAMLGD